MNIPIDSDFSDLEMQEVIRVPNDRIGVIIGKKGITKLKIEELTSTDLDINSEENSIIIKPKKSIKDPSLIWVAKDMIRAIGRGFNERIAFSLIDPEVFLRVITLEDSKNKKRMQRIRGRIIGENGRTRKIIEEVTKCNISIYGDTVTIIGRYEDGEIDIAQEAIEMIISGIKHGTVYKFLEKFRIQKKAEGYKIWKVREDKSYEKEWEKFSQDIKRDEEQQNKDE
jgi:ribosomal RNA assembly protein